MNNREIYGRVLAIQQTLDVQDGENITGAVRDAYFLASSLLEQLRAEKVPSKEKK